MRPFAEAKLSKSWSSTAPRPSLDTLSFSDTLASSVEHSSTRPHLSSSIPLTSSHHPPHSLKNINHLDQPSTLQLSTEWSNMFSASLDPSVMASLSMNGALDQLPPAQYSNPPYHASTHSRTQSLFPHGHSNTPSSWSQSHATYVHPDAVHQKPTLPQSAIAPPSRPYISTGKDPCGM